MKKQTQRAVKIGNNLSRETADVRLPGCRSAEQHAAIMEWHRTHPSAHWCVNPFEPEPDGKVYKCSFAHIYFGADGKMHMIWVTPKGRITKTLSPSNGKEFDFASGPGGTKATIKKYGAFAG